jgi:hypothetical protein
MLKTAQQKLAGHFLVKVENVLRLLDQRHVDHVAAEVEGALGSI